MTAVPPGAPLSASDSLGPGDELQLHTLVPDNLIASLEEMGGESLLRGGASVAGCTVRLNPSEGNIDCRVVVTGEYNQCVTMQTWLHEQLTAAAARIGHTQPPQPKEVTVMLIVRGAAVGAVIGKKGEGLKEIHRQTYAKIQVLRDELEAGHRPCIITGAPQHVLHAVRLVADLARLGTGSGRGAGGGGRRGRAVLESADSRPALMPAPSAPSAGRAALTALMPAPSLPTQPGDSEGADLQVPAKRQRTDEAKAKENQAESSTKLLIPSASIGSVIGKQGSGLRHIHRAHGVDIDVLRQEQAPQWPDERVVTVRGHLTARQSAVDAVLKAAYASASSSQARKGGGAPEPSSQDGHKDGHKDVHKDGHKEEKVGLKILVPAPLAGHVIGRQGSMLKSIHAQHKVNVHVEREEVMGERVVSTTGKVGPVSAAASEILRILDTAVQLSAAPARHVFRHKPTAD